MKLYERLPDHILVGRKRIRVDLDFRNVLRMLETLQRDDLMPAAREWLAVRCVCHRPIKGALEALKQLLFPEPVSNDGKRVTSFEQDADLIRAAFRQGYGINLWKDKLHWFEFRELLHGIPEGTRYMEIIGIRAREMPEPNKYNYKERMALMKAKSAVALKLTEKEQQQNYEQGVKNIFDYLLTQAKEVKPECLTEESSLKSPLTEEKHTPQSKT